MEQEGKNIKFLDYAICPLCGMAHSRLKYIGGSKVKGYGRIGGKKIDFWEKLNAEYDFGKPFGVRMPTGKSGWEKWKYINIEDTPELFKLVKAVFLKAIRAWLMKGWISKNEITQILK